MTVHSRLPFAKMLGSAVLSQALLSGANFAVGLFLIRYTSDSQYGYYILASSAVLLLASLHGSFFNPALVTRLVPLDVSARSDLVGGFLREQTGMLTIAAGLAFVVCSVLWYAGVFDSHMGPLLLATIAASLAILQRNFFRMVLSAHRQLHAVLLTDILFVLLLILGTVIAIRTAAPTIATLIVMCVAAVASGFLAARALWRFEPWNKSGAPGILRSIAPLAVVSTSGAAIHWAFSQGYMYLAAGMLDVAAVAAIAATRLMMMPINLLSTGIGTLMLPLTAGWLHRRGSAFALRRLGLFAAALTVVALGYFLLLWLTRDWIFTTLLKKEFLHRDQLLLLWMCAFIPMVIRDQLIYLLVASERFRSLTVLGSICAAVSLLAGYVGMTRFGVVGAPVGVLVGELISLSGVIVLSLRQNAPSLRSRVVPIVL